MTDEKPDNSAQMASPAYLLAALDQEFLLSDPLRGVRFLLEYEKAEEHLRVWGVNSTIVVFGSARTHENGNGEHARWYAQAREFARIASERGGAKDKDHDGTRENVIATGGGGGIIMGGAEAARRGLLSYQRSEELTADRSAVTYLDRTGQSAKGLLTSFSRMQKQISLYRFQTQLPGDRYQPALGEGTLCGTYIETDDRTGLAVRIEPIRMGGRLSEIVPG